MTSQSVNFLAGLAVGFALGAMLAATAAELPAPLPASEIVPGPLHSSTNLTPDEARAALSSALPAPATSAVAAFLAPAERSMPAFASSGWWVDAVVLPLGVHDATPNAAVGTPMHLVLCGAEECKAVVWRYRRGTAPRAVPLDLGHASATNATAFTLLGRVVGMWFDEERGAVARIELTDAGKAAIEAREMRVSAGMRVMRATTGANAPITPGGGADEIAIPWALTSVALTRDPALPTPWIGAADLRPLSEISVYPRAR